MKTVEELYSMGELNMAQVKQIKRFFSLRCKKCKSGEIAILTEKDDDGYCDTCSSPYSRFTIKCIECGNAISVRD